MTILTHAFDGLRYALRDNLSSTGRIQRLAPVLTSGRMRGCSFSLRDALLYRTLLAAHQNLAAYRHMTPPRSPAEAIGWLRNNCRITSKTDLLRQRPLYYPRGGRGLPWTIRGKTSGTTGTPLEVFRSIDSVRWEQAFKKRHWAWSGFEEGMRRASLRGDAIVPVDRAEPPFWLLNRFNNQLFVSSRHLKSAFMSQIVEALQNFRPKLLEAYPSTAFVLGSYLERENAHVQSPLCTLDRRFCMLISAS